MNAKDAKERILYFNGWEVSGPYVSEENFIDIVRAVIADTKNGKEKEWLDLMNNLEIGK